MVTEEYGQELHIMLQFNLPYRFLHDVVDILRLCEFIKDEGYGLKLQMF